MDTLQKTVKNLPHTPGVYLFLDTKKTVLYVGKAKNLHKRVSSYFTASDTLPEKTKQLVAHIDTLRIQRVGSEFDALLLEAKLIRYYNPKYNMIAKDDKSPLYIHIPQNDLLPRVSLSRKPKNEKETEGDYFGPFPNKKTALSVLRTLRHSLPFCQQKIRNGKPCFYTHLHLCDPCPSVITALHDQQVRQHLTHAYRKHITHLRWVLSGQSQKTIGSMQKDMEALAKTQHFEEAALLRNQIQTLLSIQQKHYDPFLFEETDRLEKAPQEQIMQLQHLLSPYFPSIQPLQRIECFDISTIQGTASVGSMVVMEDGIPSTNHYRRFSIKTVGHLSDTAMMKEVVERRLHHVEWPYPHLFVIDGGKGQVAVIQELLKTLHRSLPVIGLAKRFEQIIIPTELSFITLSIPASSPALQLLERIRDEAHRFAISFHRKQRARRFAS